MKIERQEGKGTASDAAEQLKAPRIVRLEGNRRPFDFLAENPDLPGSPSGFIREGRKAFRSPSSHFGPQSHAVQL
jgi:hypothetical protein